MINNTTSISTTTAVDAARFRRFGRDFETSWTDPVQHNARIVEDSGDLILQLQDLWDIEAIRNLVDVSRLAPGCSFGEFLDTCVLQRWGEGWSFNLGGINAVDALFKLTFEILLPSIEELPGSRLFNDLEQVRRGGRRPESLPPYTLRVDGSLVRYFLIDIYDGPFSSDGARLGAALLRTKL
ncbi:hypothetical protein [Microbacterium aurum]|nr:hypothetical protein [Microbacterium aurum]MBM7827703.1 hypothetical protein [Microbacterium aurum]